MSSAAEVDTGSWKEIEVTVYFTAVTAFCFLVVFEVARRRPAFAAVFDRRRSYYAAATAATGGNSSGTTGKAPPPPLIQSRLGEWLFLSTDPDYTAYADLVHTRDVIVERQRHQKQLNRKRERSANRIAQEQQQQQQQTQVEGVGEGEGGGEQEVDGVTAVMAAMERGAKTLKNKITNTVEEEEEIEVSDDGKHSQSDTDNKKLKAARRTALLTPDVVVVNGRRIHVSVVEELGLFAHHHHGKQQQQQQERDQQQTKTLVVANDDEQLRALEQQLLELESQQEQVFRERHTSMLLEQHAAAAAAAARGRWRRANRPATTADGADDQPIVAWDNDQDALDLTRVQPPSRWKYLGFRRRTTFTITTAGDAAADASTMSERVAGTRGLISQLNVVKNAAADEENDDDTTADTRKDYRAANQYLKSVSDKVTRPLSVADQELLRCVGLDAFVMLRFLRFSFHVTFYPFLLACAMLIPTYYTSDFDGNVIGDDDNEDEIDSGALLDTSGYFKYTFNTIAPGSSLLWVAWTYAVLFFSFVLYRMWVEWEVFIALRFDFLANGDAEMDTMSGMSKSGSNKATAQLAKNDELQLYLNQYRNSCLVEYVPEKYRSDAQLYEFFDSIFPGEVKRAEILMQADPLTRLIGKRQKFLERYEDLYAKHFHAYQKHRRKIEYLQESKGGCHHYLCCRCCRGLPAQPAEPTMNIGGWCCWNRKIEKTLTHYLAEIKRINGEIETEHRRLSEAKRTVDDSANKRNILARTLGKGVKYVTGEFMCDTGFVEFKNLSTKQNAIQCNIAGTTNFMTTASAPDPRDINWDNAGVTRQAIWAKKRKCEILLFTGTFFWFFVVAFVTSISNLDRLDGVLPSWLEWLIPEPDTYLYGVVQGYLPVVALELLMYLVPFTLRIVAKRYIRLKTKSETDKFVFTWHFAYRLANLIIIIVKNQVYQTLTVDSITDDVRGTVNKVAEGIAVSSQFFLNNMIVAAGTETLWELAQMPAIIVQFVTYRVVTVEAKSKRALERLEEPGTFEWGDLFPPCIFAFLVATVYCTIVPLVTGVCAVFFYLATKVYTHQALFVYAQPYEGGGKLMYLLNRTLFVIVYISIAIFALLLGLKEGRVEAPSFFGLMTVLTAAVDWKIQTKFVAPSISLNLTNARIIDNENQHNEQRIRRRRRAGKTPRDEKSDDDDVYDSFLYRQPQLNKSLWETKPRPYR